MSDSRHCVFVTGGTGYVGSRLVSDLLERGHAVRALVRPGSDAKLPAGCEPVFGNALDASSYQHLIAPADTLVQLVGVPHPSPRKAAEFNAIDLPSGLAAVAASISAGVKHLVYVSVAHPAPVMQAYIEVRTQVESAIRASGLDATILRPWYVLGPGHRWPYLILPLYKLAEMVPSLREGALRLGVVTIRQMVNALVEAVEHPAAGMRVMGVPEIRAVESRPIASETVLA
jgi:uncharacterized protein YbjT (DUF2867 family)